LVGCSVAGEGPRRRELAELVADHLFRDEDRNVFLPVVDAERQAHELRQDGGAAAPGLNDLRATGRASGVRLLEQITIDERAFPERACHLSRPYFFFFACRLDTMNLLVDLFLRVFLPLVGFPQGVTG